MKYLPVVGLEIHLQVKTKTKMFSRVNAEYFNEAPNTHIDPVSFGLPGALPVPNKTAIEKAVRLALALNCKINKKIHFDRKNYFYPDLPKGYQISQFDKPIGENGFVEIEVGDDSRRIRLTRLHIEEDTGKSLHSGNETLLDYNKSGIPLVEMVTEPDFESVEEVLAFAKRLRQIVRYTGTSDAEMQKGQMRFELNISVRKEGEKGLPNYKVEVKNIGSISVLEKVMNYEIERQSALLEKGEEIKNQTRGLKDMTGVTLFQRGKESSDDYRYFPEPDIPPITFSDEYISNIEKSMPELPNQRLERYLNLGLELEQADNFIEDKARGDYFDSVLKVASDDSEAKEISKWINTDLTGILVKNNKDYNSDILSASDLYYLIKMAKEKKITVAIAKSVIEEIIKQDKSESGSAEQIINEKGLIQIQDDSEIEQFIQEVVDENAKVITDMEKNPNALKFLVGQVMRKSKGRVNPQTAEEKLVQKLNS
ncbi:Asp-tRNA(Asn)/Glu-tRNA(Gln) amidotransferase subunit GatB [Candidatus Dojkabacteria bacterium]|uniref:Aspartyl/glutamyl-tRNA(Asn/Gln) amidotransferase subunit B n=1 Tax=Candidatus Dojkabacteria bacterium TaxID=2099670 RepID=A0A955RG82_9BACT|nr:Asp-tRNA(Asn)/Glu-tRNA(Gln) amidotransferase subunit GatB [Candidatus Dojkabacteria bacterium]